jgi:biotin carboxylase
MPTTVLCLASYVKGQEFLRECKRLGCRVLLLTVEKHRDADWPRESIDERFLMPKLSRRDHVINAVSYLARTESIDRIVALDEFDLEMASTLREHLRIPGMGETTVRYFRDKLAMRMRAQERAIPVPEFVPIFNYDRIRGYLAAVPPPWVLKPRLSASAIGIKKLERADELWPILDQLGDRQSFHLLERFIPGNVYHVDSIVSEGEVVFAEAHGYVNPPFEVYHGGGLFATSTLEIGSREERTLRDLNSKVARALGLVRGVLHTEYIQGVAEGRFYFLETAARVGGAFIVEMIEAATGINLWREWARLEVANARGEAYQPPTPRRDYAGLVISLARQEWPDTSAYSDPEIVWRLRKRHHVGLIVASPTRARVHELIVKYMERFRDEFYTSLPAATEAVD